MIGRLSPMKFFAPEGTAGGGQQRKLFPCAKKIIELRGVDHPVNPNRTIELEELPAIARILIIDDEPVVARSVKRILQQLIGDPDGIKIEIMEPDISKILPLSNDVMIITDYNMPGMNGAQIIKAVRRSKYTGIIIGMTANPISNTLPFYDSGADLVISKPFSISLFDQIIFKS